MKWLNGSRNRLMLVGVVINSLLGGVAVADPNSVDEGVQITILYDNYVLAEGCRAEWGFSCMIMGTEKNILFDAGGYGNILLGNMDTLQVDAHDADCMVISHNHLDHTGDWQTIGGVFSFLGRNSDVTVYLPPSVPSGPIRNVEATGASTQIVNEPIQLCEGVHLTGPMGTIEQSMVLDTPKGLVVITGCAHPGVVNIVRKAKDMLNKEVYFVFGGFHLLSNSDSSVRNIIRQLKELGVRKVGPSHCTGDRAIELFKQEYAENFVPMGVGHITIPIQCDFNGDGVVDLDDMVILIEHWGGDESSFDIAPGLFGDGIVDILDLELFMSYWEQSIDDVTLIAHWALDEIEGMFAADSAGDSDAFVVGGTAWQPGSGQVDGALQLDGISGCAIAGFVLNPADGPFSIFAWVKDGAPGQVVVSQQATADWLATDTEGNLMTDLKCTGRSAGPLYSETVITDGQWHRIGLVWDGSHRTLCVDGIAVADDIQPGLQSSQMGLYIGTGKAMEPGTYFSGLIDDIRVYNRAVSP